MSSLLFAVLASAGAALLVAIDWLLACRSPLVTALSIGASDMSNAIVGTPKAFTLKALAAGLPVDLAAFPTALTDVVWSVGNTDIASVNATQADGSAAEVTFSAAGATTLSVTGKNVAGDSVSASVDIVGEVPVPLVTALEIVEA